MRQVIENVESTKRQYAQRNRAAALGWRDDQIMVSIVCCSTKPSSAPGMRNLWTRADLFTWDLVARDEPSR
jgi:hypothetical protein